MNARILALLLGLCVVAACGDGGSGGQDAQSSMMEQRPTMAPAGSMMPGMAMMPMTQTTPRSAR